MTSYTVLRITLDASDVELKREGDMVIIEVVDDHLPDGIEVCLRPELFPGLRVAMDQIDGRSVAKSVLPPPDRPGVI